MKKFESEEEFIWVGQREEKLYFILNMSLPSSMCHYFIFVKSTFHLTTILMSFIQIDENDGIESILNK